MRCPQCGFENLIGSDICDNCGGDLAGLDTPQLATTYRGPVLGQHLDTLEVGEPQVLDVTADVDEAVRRMHETGPTASSSSTAGASSASSRTATPSSRWPAARTDRGRSRS